MTLLRNYCDCCFVVNQGVTLQWSHFEIVVWPSCGDSNLKSSWPFHCDESPNNVTLKTIGNSHVTNVWIFHCKLTISAALRQVCRWLPFAVLLGTRYKTTIMETLQWSLQNNEKKERHHISVHFSHCDTCDCSWNQGDVSLTGSAVRVVSIFYTWPFISFSFAHS